MGTLHFGTHPLPSRTVPLWSVPLLLKAAVVTLQAAGVPRPRWTAEQLLSGRLGCPPIELLLEVPPVTPEQGALFRADVAARANGVPLQYLMGTAQFYGREFFVGPGVFIPRPETEVFVETVLALLLAHPRGAEFLSSATGTVVDVGTGSGAIAITLALECPGIKVFGTDLSSMALKFAKRNAKKHGAAVTFFQRDLLSGFGPESADLLIANLPYLDPAEALHWPRELAWEPWLALEGGQGGVEPIGRLMRQASVALNPGGRVVLEIGMGQTPEVRALAEQNSFEVERVVPDLAGIERVVVSKWKN